MIRRLGRHVLDTFALMLIGLAIVMLSGRLAVQPVLSDSMTGYADRGDVVVGIRTDTASLHVGDVILFAPPAPYGTPGGHPVAHRIASLTLLDGKPTATTKGDANPQPDPWTLDLTRTRTAVVHLVVPHAGWPFIRLGALTTPAGRLTSGLSLMAVGGLVLVVGRPRRRARSDEPWPPPFEGEDLDARLRAVADLHAGGENVPVAAVSRFGPAPAERRPLIPRQRVAEWSVEEALQHSPIE